MAARRKRSWNTDRPHLYAPPKTPKPIPHVPLTPSVQDFRPPEENTQPAAPGAEQSAPAAARGTKH